MERACTVIVNPASGRGKTLRALPEITRALAGSGLDHEVRVSTDPSQPAAIARDAIAADRIVVACGGDGLVGLLAGVCADHGGTLGIIPTGSGNDFARHLGYDPRHPVRAVDTLVTGPVTAVDLGRVGDRWFTCVASVGFDAEANAWANGVERLGGTALYVAAALRTLVQYRPRSFLVTIDGEEQRHEAWLVAVGNGPSYGGGMRVTPRARTDDGLLDVTIVGAVSRGEFLRTFPKVFSGRHVDHPAVTTAVGREIRVDTLDHDLAIFADGEPAGHLPGVMAVRPGALRVIIPG